MSKSLFLSHSLQGRILKIKFNDPSSRNSFSLRAAEELHEVCVRNRGQFDVLIFTSVGRVFCSGGNLTDYANMNEAEQGIEVNRKIASILQEIEKLPAFTICLVQGDCFGGGVELMSAFDRVFAAPHVLFGLWQRKISLSFGWGGGRRIKNRIGISKLRQLAIETNAFGSNEAMQIGLVDAVFPSFSLMEQAEKLADRELALSRAPLVYLKGWTTKKERETFESLWWNEDHRAVLKERQKKRS